MGLVRVRMDDVTPRLMPGRLVREILSGRVTGAAGVAVRVVEIPPAKTAAPRFPHVHHAVEEVIVVAEGGGATWVDGRWWRIERGDVLQIPAGAKHATVNPGPGDLKLLCFFPSAAPELDYTEFPDLRLSGWESAG